MYLAIEGGGEREERERERVRLSRGFEIVFPSPFHTDGYWRLPGTANPINVRLAKVLGTVPESFLAAVPMAKGPLMGPIGILGRNFDWIFFECHSFFGIGLAFLMPSHCLCPAGFALEAAWRHPQRAKLVDLNTEVIYYIYIYICVCYVYMHIQCKYKFLSIYIIYIYILI